MSASFKNSAPPPIERVLEMVRGAHRRLLRKHTLQTWLVPGCLLAVGLALTGWAEAAFYLSPALKTTLWILLFVGSIAGFYVRYKQTTPPDFSAFYRDFARQYRLPQMTDALDLYLHPETDPGNRLREAAIRQNLSTIDPDRLREKLSKYVNDRQVRTKNRRAGGILLGGAIALLALAVMQPGALDRLAQPWQRFHPPNPYTFTVTPGDVTLEQGSSLSPSIHFIGEKPDAVRLYIKTDIETDYRERPPAAEAGDSIAFASLSLNSDASYYLEMDGHRTATYRADIQLLPRFESLSLQVDPPAYTGLDTLSYTYPFSTIQAYAGSEIRLSGRANKPLSALIMRRHGSADSVDIRLDESLTFSETFELAKADTLTFAMRDRHGLSNKNPFRVVLQPIPDQSPFVEITRPEGPVDMKNPEPLALEYRLSDDFGITSVRLHYRLQRAFGKEAKTEAVSLPLPSGPRERTHAYEWNLKSLDPKPRDVITYWVEVTDNDAYSGSKTSRSQWLTVTFPSLSTYVDELENHEDKVREELEDITDSYDRMREQYDSFKEQMKQNPQGSWQQEQQLEEIRESQQAIDEQVKKLNEEFEQIRQELSESDLLSEETRRAYQELQELMEEIDDPELLKALEELQEAMNNLSPEQLRKAMEKFEFNEQQYRERLNRTTELFKTLKLNSDLEKMAGALEKLAEEEEALSGQSGDPSEERQRQEAVMEDLDKLARELQKMDENIPRKAKPAIEQLKKQSEADFKKAGEQLKENIEQLKDSQNGQEQDEQDKDAINRQQQQIGEQLRRSSEQARQARQQLGRQQRQVNIAALQYLLHSLINLSDRQEELTRETEQLAGRSQAFVEKARVQQQIHDQFERLADSLFTVSSEIPSFSNRINEKKNSTRRQLSAAVEQLAERDRSKATFSERQSLGGINELASMLASLLDQLQNMEGQGSGGAMTMQQFMEQMQNMSGDQQQLNQQIQQLINDIQGDRLSNDQVKRLNQMARQQNQIRKQIEELQRRGGLEAGDKVLSELERLSEQMEETINDLRGGQLDDLLKERQQNILSRMLNAEDALQERGEEEKREGTTARETPDNVPPEVTLEELQKQIRRLLNDPDRTQFAPDYQRLIEQYFRLLQEREVARPDTTAIY